MSETLKQVLREAIARREKELDELRAELHEAESEDRGSQRKAKRNRKQTGLKQGSIPSLILDVLTHANRPMDAAEIAKEISKNGKKVESRFVAAAISRYLDANRFFERTPDGLYAARH